MDEFVWKDSFNIGIDAIDAQHRTLLGHVNECMKKAESHKLELGIDELVEKLKRYAQTHFACEEQLMREIDYPELPTQLAQHELFRAQVAALERAAAGGERHVIISAAALVRDWYLQHILEHDKRIGVYRRSLGAG